jgi:hypothetical protein
MPRLIIIDKLIRSEHGHYLEYALRVGEALQQEGLEPVYLVNRKFKGRTPKGLKKVINFDFERVILGAETKERKARERARRDLLQKKRFSERLKLSSLGVASAALIEMRRLGDAKGVDRMVSLMALLLSGSLFGLRLLGVIVAVVLWPIRALWRGAVAGGRAIANGPMGRWLGARFAYLGQRLAFGDQYVIAKRLARGALLDDTGDSAQARSLAAALMRLRPTGEDIVLCTTVKEADLDVYLAVVKAAPQLGAPTWNFIFREPIFSVLGCNYVVGQAHRGLRTKLLGFKALAGLRTNWWADTDELVEQYNCLGSVEFGTLPIVMPHALAELSALASTPRDLSAPVCFGYFGDARPEKGYQEMPGALAFLSRRKRHWIKDIVAKAQGAEDRDGVERELGPPARTLRERMLRRRLRRIALLRGASDREVAPDLVSGLPDITVLAQSNFNVPEGVPATRAARLRLQSMDDIGLSVFTKPPPSEQYVANFGEVDAVLLFYTHGSYVAGSSGVFAEALMAGRPVVVTDQTWGGRRLRSLPDFVEHMWHEIAETAVSEPGHLRLDRLAAAQPWYALSRRLTHLAIRAEFKCRLVTDEVEWGVDFMMNDGSILRRTRILSSRNQRAAAVIEIPFGALATRRRVSRLNTRLTHPDWAAEEYGLDRSTRHSPLSAVGVIVQDVAELAPAMAEIARYSEHYRQTAATVSKRWAVEHSRERLVERILRGRQTWSAEEEDKLYLRTGTADGSAAPPRAKREIAQRSAPA